MAESVVVDIPRPRRRTDVIHHPGYYLIRNHLLDFLTTGSRAASGADDGSRGDSRDGPPGGDGPRHPLTVRPGLVDGAAPGSTPGSTPGTGVPAATSPDVPSPVGGAGASASPRPVPRLVGSAG